MLALTSGARRTILRSGAPHHGTHVFERFFAGAVEACTMHFGSGRKRYITVDRGLATVITLISGLALSIVQACSEDSHPPVASQVGFAPTPGAGAGGGNSGGGATTIGGSGDTTGNNANNGNGGGTNGGDGGTNATGDGGGVNGGNGTGTDAGNAINGGNGGNTIGDGGL